MEAIDKVPCGITTCHRTATNGAIFGTERFCLVPAWSAVKPASPLIRYNLCDLHLKDVRSNFVEIGHDEGDAEHSSI